MKPDGSCPTCGRVLPRAAPPDAGVGGEASAEGDADDRSALTAKDVNLRELAGKEAKAPWHFKVLMVLLAIYLGWRLVQLVQLIF
jgi:hypothetical protein